MLQGKHTAQAKGGMLLSERLAGLTPASEDGEHGPRGALAASWARDSCSWCLAAFQSREQGQGQISPLSQHCWWRLPGTARG